MLMMEKYRVHEVAKDLGIPSKDVVTLLGKYFDSPKKHMTALEKDELSIIFEHYTNQTQVESFDKYFETGAEKKLSASPKTADEKPSEDKPTAVEPEPVAVSVEVQQPAVAAQPKAVTETVQQKKPQGQTGGQRQPGSGAQQHSKPNYPNRRPQQQPQQHGGTQQRPQQQPQAQAAQVGQSTDNKNPNKVVAGNDVRHVDMRTVKVNLDKYNERYETIATSSQAKKDTGVRKQKLNQKSAQKGKPFLSRREKEEQKLKKIQMERERRQRLEITIPTEITIGDLAGRLKVQASEIIKRLMGLGIMASMTEVIDYDTASMVAIEIGAKVSPEVVITIEDRLFDDAADTTEALVERPPVVVVMGHVDHGKTSLLDAIRDANVTSGEAGGITQHIGAYQVDINGKKATFLDTPGHAAFTSMRARGAQVTDIAILVVAADDGIMPQTVEAINHAKAADVPIIVAINKMDKEDANPDRIKQELTEYELVSEEWGGDTICVEISAKKRMNIDTLLEMVQLTADVRELKANPYRNAKGTVIEARLDKGLGPVATILVQSGTLSAGDVIIAGTALGRVRVMQDDRGNTLEKAGPSTPVEITGLSEVPQAGDIFNAVADERLAKELVDQRRHEAKQEMFSEYQKVTLDNLFSHISQGDIQELKVIVKADVQGSVEAVRQSLEKITNDEVRVRVIHGGVGAVSESDVMLARASNAVIVGFNVRYDPVAKEIADREGVDIHLYRVIYDAIEDIQDAMKGMLAPKFRDVELGRAEVRNVFKITGVGTVAGCYVLDGKIARNAKIRVVRDGIIVADDIMDSLKRFKDDVKEVASGYECGIGLTKFADIKEGDVFEAYITEEYRD